ncbi:MAG TPA: glutaredoxin family protein [Usitatibacter sp.]|jgi:glutaredoxin|nr:glutaredoxin family protein [Usitatibacter sp.]
MATRHIAGAVLAAALAASLTIQAQTNVYRWTDKDGKIHFSDTPPPEEAKSVSQKRMGGGYVDQEQLPYATQVAMKRNPVTLYVGTQCGDPCASGRDLLANRGVPFTERNAQSSAAENEALRKASGGLEVPFLLVGESKLKGYDEGSWNAALDAAGYPRTRLPGQAPAVPASVAAQPPKPAAPAAAQ